MGETRKTEAEEQTEIAFNGIDKTLEKTPNGQSVSGTSEEYLHSSGEPLPGEGETDFWSLPVIRKKTYRAPAGNGRTTDTVPFSAGEEKASRIETIPPRDSAKGTNTVRPTRPADRPFRTAVYATSQEYKDRLEAGKEKIYGFGEEDREKDAGDFSAAFQNPEGRRAGETVCERTGNGWLVRQITVRRWSNDFSFYSSFARDARISHRKQGIPAEAVPFSSYVPQYAHMDSHQLAYYLWFRDNARVGNWLKVDFAYILLYIFEILNLPDYIPPAEGIGLLCRLWAQYRQVYRNLDTYLCEWVPDYALIHDVPLDACVEPFLPDLVRRSQFKEFYLDHMCSQNGEPNPKMIAVLAGVLLETYSDYDYTKSRHYNGGNREQYDRCITEALAAVLEAAWREHRGMFCLNRTYRLTRDSFCGAIIATEEKRRIDVAFQSCIRSPDTRRFVTGIVKYAENKLRYRLKIRSKLSASEISAEDRALVDRYFGPEEERAVRKKEEEAEYLKQYEAETTGFDFSEAHRIEEASWLNASRLTGEETEPVREVELPEETPLLPEGAMEMADTCIYLQEKIENEETATVMTPSAKEKCTEKDRLSLTKEAVAALLAGQFGVFCRENGLFPGRMAEEINEIFLELVGDILVEADGSQFRLIEEYREDAAAWSKT